MLRKNINDRPLECEVLMAFALEVNFWRNILQKLESEERFSESNKLRGELKASIVKDTIEVLSTPFVIEEVERLASSIT